MAKKIVKVLLESKKRMTDKKGRHWLGNNPGSEKATSFRKTKNIVTLKSQPKKLRTRTERHEYIEWQKEKQGKSYPVSHKIALKKEKKPIKGVKFVERKS